jgi:hypothetical protein
MIAIQTKYISPTNTRGSRIKAFVSSDMGHNLSVVIPYDHSLNCERLHFKAVQALIKKHKLDWDTSNMRFGGVKNGYVFCFNNSKVEV